MIRNQGSLGLELPTLKALSSAFILSLYLSMLSCTPVITSVSSSVFSSQPRERSETFAMKSRCMSTPDRTGSSSRSVVSRQFTKLRGNGAAELKWRIGHIYGTCSNLHRSEEERDLREYCRKACSKECKPSVGHGVNGNVDVQIMPDPVWRAARRYHGLTQTSYHVGAALPLD